MKEYLIRKGQSHTLVNLVSLDRCEAFSFNSFGESIGITDAKSAIALGGNAIVEVKFLSFVGKGNIVDIYFQGKHCLKEGLTPIQCQSYCRSSLLMASHIPYRVNHKENISHIVVAVDYSVRRENINKLFNIAESDWEPMF